VTPTVYALHQLPSPPADFTGREAELATLRSALTHGNAAAIFGVQGMGGVGKTVFALKLAEELTGRFPDAQLYLNLRGVSPQPLTAAQAMAHVVRSFDPEARLPESEDELAGLYRSMLFGKRVLLLMDNAAGRNQVEPLVPPLGSLLLVTSRVHFVLPGMTALNLDEMPEEDAHNLLLTIAPRIASDSEEIARLCGRLPLALRLAGSAIAERPSLSPSGYLKRLKEGKEGFSDVEAALDLSYQLLDEELRRFWRLLAVFPSTFDGSAAAAVWEVELEVAQRRLEELVRISLVDWEEKEGRYRLHDLSRSFANAHINPAEREAGQWRFTQHFLEVLRAVDNLYLKGGACILIALKLFDTEWMNIQAGQSWTSGYNWNDDVATRICADYPDVGTFVLMLRQDVLEQIHWREIGLAAARRCKDRSLEAAHLGNMGIAYRKLGNSERAIDYHEQQLVIVREIGDRAREAGTIGSLGTVYLIRGEISRAIGLYETALMIYREVGDRRGEEVILGNLGSCHSARGDWPSAIKMFEQALIIDREIGDRQGEATDLGNLGNVYLKLGDSPRAIDLYQHQLSVVRELGDRQGEGNALGNLGNAHLALGGTERAVEFYEQQLAIARKIGDRRGIGNSSWNLGLLYETEGDLVRAADSMQVLVDFELEIAHADAEKDAARVEALRARISE
jgi:tetratricopeptide (TPR) repeat protein